MQMHFYSKRREKKKSIKRSIILAYSVLFQLVTNRCLYSFIVNWFNCFAARCVVLDLLGGHSFLTFKGRNTIFGYICRSGKVLLLRMCLAFLKKSFDIEYKSYTHFIFYLREKVKSNLLENKSFEKRILFFSIFHVSKVFSSPSIRTQSLCPWPGLDSTQDL